MPEGLLMLRFLLDLKGVDNWHWRLPMPNICNVKIPEQKIPADNVMPAKKFKKILQQALVKKNKLTFYVLQLKMRVLIMNEPRDW